MPRVSDEAADAVRRCGQPGAGRGTTLSVIFRKVEDAARVPGQIAHGLGEDEPAPLDETDSEAVQPGHVLRTVPGADAILVEAPVEDVVRRLDRPVPAIEGEEAFRGCGFRGQAGDTVGCLGAALAGLDLQGFAADGEDLSDAGEVEVVVEPTGDPDGAPFATAVLGLGTLVHEVRRAPGDGLSEQEADVVLQGPAGCP